MGKKYCFPSKVAGSPRHMRSLWADALAIARRPGMLTYFITQTCNPYWEEILRELAPGQTAADRPDVVTRVFHARLELMTAFLKSRFGGQRKYYLKVIEYQFRRLPHAHVVVACENPPRTGEAVDLVISYELPTQRAVSGTSF